MFLDELYLENENATVEEEEMQFCEGADGLFEIALESEMSWNNIVMDTIKEEFVAIKNESQVLLEEAKKGFFQTIIEWVRKKAKQIGEFFKKLFERLKVYFTNIDSFVKNYAERINKFDGKVEVKVHDWKNDSNAEIVLKQLAGVSSKVLGVVSDAEPKVLSADDIAMKIMGVKLGEINKFVFSKVRGEKVVAKTFGAGEVKSMFNDLKSTQATIKALNVSKDLTLKSLKDMEYLAKKGLGLVNKEDKTAVEKIKNSIQSYKNAHTVADRILGLEITILNQKLADALKVCKAAIVGKKPKEEKEKKEAKKESANLFTLI